MFFLLQVLQHLSGSESVFDIDEILCNFEKKLTPSSPLHLDILVYRIWKLRAKAVFKGRKPHQKDGTRLLENINTVDIVTLDEIMKHCDNSCGVELLNAALEKFFPLAEQYQKDDKKLPESYMSLIMYQLDVGINQGDKYLAYWKLLAHDQENANFDEAFKKVMENIRSIKYKELFEIAKVQQPKNATFTAETIQVITEVVKKLDRNYDESRWVTTLPNAVKELMTWAVDLCIDQSSEKNSLFVRFVEVIDVNCTRVVMVLECVLIYLRKKQKLDLLRKAESLADKLPKMYMKYFCSFKLSFEEYSLQQLDQQPLLNWLKRALRVCQIFSPLNMGLHDFVEALLDADTSGHEQDGGVWGRYFFISEGNSR